MWCVALRTSLQETLLTKRTAGSSLLFSRMRSMSTFPVDKPAWAVSTLLKRPDDAIHRQKLQEALSNDDVKRLYALSGLKLSDMSNDADELARVLVDVNKLRDFLSHIQTVSISENVDSVEPLVRIAEPVEFSCKEPAGGLWQSEDPSLDLGEKVLETAKHRSGPYLVVED